MRDEDRNAILILCTACGREWIFAAGRVFGAECKWPAAHSLGGHWKQVGDYLVGANARTSRAAKNMMRKFGDGDS